MIDKRVPALLAIGFLLCPTPTNGSEVDDFVEHTVREFRKHEFRAARRGNEEGTIVAVICPADRELNGEFTVQCDRLQHELAESLERYQVDVVAPRRSFDAIRTWEHVGCSEDAAQRRGWDVIELLAVGAGRKRRGEAVRFRATEVHSGNVLHEGVVTFESPFPRSAKQAWEPPFTASAADRNEERLASCLAHQLICPLRELPEIGKLEDVVVTGPFGSPAEHDWLLRIGSLLSAQLNRVIDSGWYTGESNTLELSTQRKGPTASRLVPRILAGSGDEVLVDGSRLSGADCLVQIKGELSDKLGDLTLFGPDLDAARSYLRRQRLSYVIRRVPSDDAPGLIIAQDPTPGTAVDRVPSNTVNLQISARRPEVEPPTGVPRQPLTGQADELPPIEPASGAIEAETPIVLRSPSPGQQRVVGAEPEPADGLQETIRVRIFNIAGALGVSTDALNGCYDVLDGPEVERRAFERLIEAYDPRREDLSIVELWTAWYEFSSPSHEPYFPGSPVSPYAGEVADALFERLERELFDD